MEHSVREKRTTGEPSIMSNQTSSDNNPREAIGTFIAKAVGIEWGNTDKGAPQVGIRFRIQDPLAADRNGRSYTYYGQFTDTKMGEKTVAERTVEALIACGCRLKDGDPMDTDGFEKNEVEIVMNKELYEGKWSEKVSFVNARGQVFMKNKMDDQKRKEFSMSLRGLVQKVRGDMSKGGATEASGVPVGPDGKPKF